MPNFILDNGAPGEDQDNFLKRMQIAIELQKFRDEYAKGIAGGGRIGYRHPMQDGAATFGVSGGGYDVTADGQRRRGISPVGFDAKSEFGNNEIGARYQYGESPYYGLNYLRRF